MRAKNQMRTSRGRNTETASRLGWLKVSSILERCDRSRTMYSKEMREKGTKSN